MKTKRHNFTECMVTNTSGDEEPNTAGKTAM